MGISRTFQATRLFARMSVLENVMIGRHVRTRGGFLAGMAGPAFTGASDRREREYCRGLLEELGLSTLAAKEAHSLPFGRQRVVEIARALASEPRLLLLDEPACGLNAAETEDMAGLISRIRDRGVTVLIVEHDMSLVMGISDEVLALGAGKRIAEGTPREVQADPEVIAVYLGDERA